MEMLRGVAALSVLFYHISATVASQWPEAGVTPDSAGAAGVDLFFIISGFVMAKLVWDDTAFKPWRFLWHRVSRIVPLYYAAMFALLLVGILMPSLLRNTDASPHNFLLSLFFVPHSADGELVAPFFFIGWTLNYEMFFYVLVMLSAWLFRDRSLAIASIAVMLLALAGLAFAPSGVAGFYTDPIILEFAMGIACFHLWRLCLPHQGSPVFLALFALGVWLLAVRYEVEPGPWRALSWGVPAFMIVFGALLSFRFRSVLLEALGSASYALYLTHVFVVVGYVRVIMPAMGELHLHWTFHYAAITAIALCVAWLAWVLFDRPASRWLRRLPAQRYPLHLALK